MTPVTTTASANREASLRHLHCFKSAGLSNISAVMVEKCSSRYLSVWTLLLRVLSLLAADISFHKALVKTSTGMPYEAICGF